MVQELLAVRMVEVQAVSAIALGLLRMRSNGEQ
jgi:hypothetical protein